MARKNPAAPKFNVERDIPLPIGRLFMEEYENTLMAMEPGYSVECMKENIPSFRIAARRLGFTIATRGNLTNHNGECRIWLVSKTATGGR